MRCTGYAAVYLASSAGIVIAIVLADSFLGSQETEQGVGLGRAKMEHEFCAVLCSATGSCFAATGLPCQGIARDFSRLSLCGAKVLTGLGILANSPQAQAVLVHLARRGESNAMTV